MELTHRLNKQRASGILVAIGLGCALAATWAVVVKAADVANLPWEEATQATIRIVSGSEARWQSWYQPNCEPMKATVEDYAWREERDVCVVSSPHAKLAVYLPSPSANVAYALKRNGDDAFHRITPLTPTPSKLVLLPNDTVLGASQEGPDVLALYSLDDFYAHATSTPVPTSPTTSLDVYTVDTSAAMYFADGVGNRLPVRYIAVSKNGNFAAAQVLGHGIVRIDLRSRSVKLIADEAMNDSDIVLAISNDGRRIAVTGGEAAPHRVYSGLDACGVTDSTAAITAGDACHSTSFADTITSWIQPGRTLFNPEFSEDGMSFVVQTWKEGGEFSLAHTLIFNPDPYSYRLEYLALGDSYSSGEGDIDTTFGSPYLPGTEQNGQCHLSRHSYPFHLRDAWGIDKSLMESVACSGARVLPDYYGGGVYHGQGNRLAHLNEEEQISARNIALSKFTPGSVKQIEFVKKYKPKILTFTGGGNDVGFASILEYCASSYKLFGLIPMNETCAYAANSQMLANLNREIDEQYDINKAFIEAIRIASPETKIYMIGYPQFVALGSTCKPNSEVLNEAERIMIRASVSRFNNTLKRVAQDTGIYYVDIESSLAGGQICEGSKYMTGPVKAIAKNKSFAKDNNMYHPNARGHERIAAVIDDKISNGMNYQLLDIPLETQGNKIVRQAVLPDYAGVGSTYTITMDPGMFMPNGQVTIEMFSQPVRVGAVLAGHDGSLHTTVTIPATVGIGTHLLVLSGKGHDGEPLQVQQFVRVTSGMPNDIDGDSLPDDKDKCFAVSEWYEDGKNICAVDTKLAMTQESIIGSSTGKVIDSELIAPLGITKGKELATTSIWDSRKKDTAPIYAKDSQDRASTAVGSNSIIVWLVGIVTGIIVVGAAYAKITAKNRKA